MKPLFRKSLWLAASIAAALSLTPGSVLAHEGREVGEYRFVVGWIEEPTYEGMKNGVELRVTRLGETMQGHGHESSDSGQDSSMEKDTAGDGMAAQSGGHGVEVPVEGLEKTLQVEVTHVPSEASKVMNLRAVLNEPGRYAADLIPTVPGVYEFRVFGSAEGTAIDETFISRGGGGGFDDVRSVADLQFPERLPEVREIESAVRGALSTSQQAQDSALQADDGASTANTVAIAAMVLGVLGIASGVGGLVAATRRRGAP